MFKKSTLISSLIPLAVLSIFASITGVNAESNTDDNSVYQVEGAYEISIPATVTVDSSTNIGTLDVSGTVQRYHKLGVKVESTDNNYSLKCGKYEAEYTISADGLTDGTNGIKQFSYSAGKEANSFSKNIAVNITDTSKATVSGEYTDTLTFTMECQTTRDYTLTYDPAGGTLEGALSKELAYGEAYGELPIPELANCTFGGWYKAWEPHNKDKVAADSIMGDTDITIYAHWTGMWNVNIDPNGGELYVMDKNITAGSSEENPLKDNNPHFKVSYRDGAYNRLLISAKKEGYTCTGYFDAATGGVEVWDAGGASLAGKKYYTNLGGDRGNVWINNTVVQGVSFTFYPQWAANSYTVVYNSNATDTEGSTAPSSHNYAEEKSLTQNGFTRKGYTFDGWNTKADGSGTPYSNGQSVINLTSENNGRVILYAIWKETSSSNENVNNTEPSDEKEESTASIQEDFISDESDSDVSLNELITDSNSDNTEAEDANVETESQSVGQTESIEESIEPEQLVTEEEIEKATAGE